MCNDFRLEDRTGGITTYTDNGTDRAEDGEWTMESEAT